MASSSEIKNTLEKFLIPLTEIKTATNNFSEKNVVGDGGFGKVYKGKLSKRWGDRTAAIKRRDSDSRQGKHEFETEIQMASSFQHPNIISFIGYCDEGEEMIIVYEYATNGSLADHIGDVNMRGRLTWAQRLNICLGAARGLKYLHSGLGDDHRIIHRDVKSANILLDEDMKAKISDFGLSKLGLGNQQHSHIYTTVAGTGCYLDPSYNESGILNKESDIYSFGVVMFETLIGLLAFHQRIINEAKRMTLINLVRQNEKDGLHKFIDPDISNQIDEDSLKKFKCVAFECISLHVNKRPTMNGVVKEIEKALEYQENSWKKLLPSNYQEIIRRLDPKVAYKNKGELESLLFAGILIDEDTKWFCMNEMNKKVCLMISAKGLFDKNDPNIIGWQSFRGRRFKVARFHRGKQRGDYVHTRALHVIAPLLSLESGYAVFLICKYNAAEKKDHKQSIPPNIYINFFYGKENMCVNSARWKDEGWIEMELFRFMNHEEVTDFELHLRWECVSGDHRLYVEGIEFRPIENENVNSGILLPHHYAEIIQRSDSPVLYSNKQELYSRLSTGVFIDDGKKIFVSELNKKKSLVIPAKKLFDENDEHFNGWKSFANSRFSHVACFKNVGSKFVHKKAMRVTATLLSLESTYAVFLICKYTGKEHKAHTKSSPPDICFKLVYGENIISPSSAEWKDEEWMEVELFMFTNHMVDAKFEIHLKWTDYCNYGLYVEGIEFRPIEMATNEKDKTKVKQPLKLEQDTEWEKMLPNDYEDIISRSMKVPKFSTKKELYLLLVKGILIDDNTMWFGWDASNRKRSVMVSPKCFTLKHLGGVEKMTHPRSRFSTTYRVDDFSSVEICGKIQARMLSPNTPYAAWLVYNDYAYCDLNIASLTLGNQKKKTRRVYLHESSKIVRPMNDPKYQKKEYIGTGSVKLDRRRRKRDDGWYEVELFPFFNDIDAHDEIEVGLHINPESHDNCFCIEGIEFRPQ